MKILFVTSECAPYSKSGGLADVAFSLPPALVEAGHQVEIFTPLYKCVKDRFAEELTKVKDVVVELGGIKYGCGLHRATLHGVPVWFLEYNSLFDRDRLYGYDDDKFRFALFSKASIDLLNDYDFVPEIIHCNDWESALSVIYLKNEQAWNTDLQNIKTVFTIHNIAYQGQFGAEDLQTTFALPGGWYDGGLGYEYQGRHDVNLMKGAMLVADAVSTVSPTYAKELHYPQFGKGLEGVVDIVDAKTYGILNGIDMDHYDPMLDKRIPASFSLEDTSGKAICKKSIQEKFGLEQEERWPLLCSVARLVEQKGIELIKQILPQLMNMGVQLIVFGQGEQRYIDYFNWAMQQWPGQIGFSSDYSEQVAAEVFAGSDMYLMPSQFEPCGLSQMMAMRYGTVPIVHETGGLKDSVRPYSDFDGIGDGFSFSNYTGKDLLIAIEEAVKLYFGDEEMFHILQRRCMAKDFSWQKSAGLYTRMYSEISTGSNTPTIPFDDAYKILKTIYTRLDTVNRGKTSKLRRDGSRVVQINMTGNPNGIFYIKFLEDGLEIQPYSYQGADTILSSSFANLYGMAMGMTSADKLFMNGQMKVEGNMSVGVELKNLFTPMKL